MRKVYFKKKVKWTPSEQGFPIHTRINDKTPDKARPISTDQGNRRRPASSGPTLLLGEGNSFLGPLITEELSTDCISEPRTAFGREFPQHRQCLHHLYLCKQFITLWAATAVGLSCLQTRPAGERLSNPHYSEHLTPSSWQTSSTQARLPGAKKKQLPNPWSEGTPFLHPHAVVGPAPANSRGNQPSRRPSDALARCRSPVPRADTKQDLRVNGKLGGGQFDKDHELLVYNRSLKP